MSPLYSLLSEQLQNKINNFYREYLRMIYHIFNCPTAQLRELFKLPALEEQYSKV